MVIIFILQFDYFFLFFCFSGISPGHFVCPDFVGKNIQELCHVNDLQQLTKHLQEGNKFSEQFLLH